MARRPVIAGNWKMHNLQSESVELINGLMKELKELNKECDFEETQLKKLNGKTAE